MNVEPPIATPVPTPTRVGAVFVTADVERAEKWITEVSGRPITRAIHFRNALHAFLRDLDRLQDARLPLTVMAVDTTEVTALTNYSTRALNNFSFASLLNSDSSPERSERLRILDQLVNQHLLQGRGEPFLLLPPHADEIQIIRHAVETKERDYAGLRGASPFAKLSSRQQQQIRAFFAGLSDKSLVQEWQKFRVEFLPDITDQVLTELLASTKAAASLEAFVAHAPHMSIQPSSGRRRSLVEHVNRAMPGSFDWSAYVGYSRRADVQNRAREIRTVVSKLLEQCRGIERSRRPDIVATGASRDAQAFAIVDALNTFFVTQNANVRVELVSRSPTLQSVLASLPDGIIRVTLRHPLFLPDIYDFDRSRLNRLGESLLRVDSILASAIDINVVGDQVQSIKAVEEVGLDVVDVLEGMLTVRQTLESDAGGKSARNREDRDSLPQNSDWLLVKEFFAAVERGGPNGEDLFSADLFRHLVERNRTVAEFARPHVFEQRETLDLRIIDFFSGDIREAPPETLRPRAPIDGFMPDALMVIRASTGGFRRLFHIHSRRVAKLIRSSTNGGQLSGSDKHATPTLAKVPVDTLFVNLDAAFSALAPGTQLSDANSDTVVFNLDATLLICIAFASKRRFDTAIALASAVLHKMTSEMRQGQDRRSDESHLREYLAYRELFLFRHHCERVLARHDFFASERRLTDSKGSVIVNLARAQRDLDFAALMSEEVERCAGGPFPSPSGEQLLLDGRLKQAHFGAWIDQLLMIKESEYSDTTILPSQVSNDGRLHRNRLDILTTAGLVKELTIEAHAVRLRTDAVDANHLHGEALKRYLAHLEARSLQGALLAFLVFLAYPISPPLHRFWLGDPTLEPERVLVFRDWHSWWLRYKSLADSHDFSMRSRPLIDVVCQTLISAQSLPDGQKGAPRRGSVRDPASLAVVLNECLGVLDEMAHSKEQNDELISTVSSNIGFVSILSRALCRRIRELIPKRRS